VTNTGSAAVGSAGSAAVVTNTGSGSAAIVTNTGSAGSAALVVPPPANAALTLTTTPDGAEIFINGVSTGKKTPQTITLPRGKLSIAFRLKGYEDLFMKDVALDGDISKEVALHKAHTTSGTGHGSAHTGTGKGSAKACDTCLERPD
jgi:PEGA domain